MRITRRAWLAALAAWGFSATQAEAFIRRIAGRIGNAAGAAVGQGIAQVFSEVAAAMVVIGTIVVLPILLIVELVNQACDAAGLTEEEKKRVLAIGEKATQEFLDIASNTPPDQWHQAVMQRMLELEQKYHDELKAQMPPEKWARFQQVMLQLRGAVGMEDAAIADRLKLDDSQRAKIAELMKHLQEQAKEPLPERLPGRLLHFGRLFAEREKARRAALDLLTEEQQAAWKEMQGDVIPIREWFGLDGGLLRSEPKQP